MSRGIVPEGVLAAWNLEGASCEPHAVGLINQTYVVRHTADRFILQRLHPVFSAEVHLDIDVITRHLATKGLTTPRLVPTCEGALWLVWNDGGIWRLQTFIDGVTLSHLPGPTTAAAAGRGVGTLHAALLDLEHTFHFRRPSFHDTKGYLAHLHTVLDTHRKHRRFDETAPVAEAILEHGRDLPSLEGLPARIIHGDLKCSNLLLNPALDRVIAVVDLDTFARGTLAVEMGDALRSWCNPKGEDTPDAAVDETLFAAAVQGYAEGSGGFVTAAEQAALAKGMETICLELAARFCADALEERYFGWDRDRFASRGAHNLVRARGQLALAASVRTARPRLENAVLHAFSSAVPQESG